MDFFIFVKIGAVKEFETAKMDDLTKMLTVAVILLFVAVPFFPLDAELNLNIRLLIMVVGFTVVFISYLHVPRNFQLSKSSLSFRNGFRTVEIPLNEITEASRSLKKFQFRTFGIGGLFGYFGRFNGTEKWFVTNRNKKIKLITSGQIFVISPEEPEEFLKALNALKNNISI